MISIATIPRRTCSETAYNHSATKRTMAGSLSPVLSLQRCDEDIDLLSELLCSNSNGSSSNNMDIAESLLSDDMDDLTGYLCRNSKRPNRGGEGSLSGQHQECLDNLNLDCDDSDVSMNLVLDGPVHTKGKSESRIDKPSMTNDTKSREQVYTVIAQKEPKCMNKNAVAARENRQKRKKYIENIEKEVAQLKEENAALKMKVSCQSDSVEKLNEQVKYLQGVIANQSTISALLQNIQNTAGVTLKSSWANMGKPESDACSTLTQGGKLIVDNCKSRLRKSKRKCVFESESGLSPDKKLCFEKENTNGNVQLTSGSKSSPSVKSDVNSNSTTKNDQDVLNLNQQTSAGVCLHVSGKQVSLEFCSACSKMASTTRFLDDHTFKARPISRHEVAILLD